MPPQKFPASRVPIRVASDQSALDPLRCEACCAPAWQPSPKISALLQPPIECCKRKVLSESSWQIPIFTSPPQPPISPRKIPADPHGAPHHVGTHTRNLAPSNACTDHTKSPSA